MGLTVAKLLGSHEVLEVVVVGVDLNVVGCHFEIGLPLFEGLNDG